MLYKVITKGKLPFQVASHVISSTTSAAANTSSAIFSRVFVKKRISLSGTVRSLNKSAFKRSFSTRNVPPPESPDQLPSASSAAPLYRTLSTLVAHSRSDFITRENHNSMDSDTYQVVPAPSRRRRASSRRYSVPQDGTCPKRGPCRRRRSRGYQAQRSLAGA